MPSKLGQEVVLDASGSSDPGGNPLSFRWDFADGTTATGPRVTHAFNKIGPHSVGVTVTNGRFSDLAYRDFLVYEDLPEFGTEGQAADWSWRKSNPRGRLHVKRGHEAVVGPADAHPQPAIQAGNQRRPRDPPGGQVVARRCRVEPSGNPISLLYPRVEEGRHPAGGQDRVGLLGQDDQHEHPRLEGLDAHGDALRIAHQVLPVPALRRPAELAGRRRLELKTVPLHGNDVWKLKGEVPATLNWMTIEFYPWGGAPFRVWIDGMSLK